MAKMKVILMCGRGGHMQEMNALRSAWEKYDYSYVTFYSEKFKDWDEPHTFVTCPRESVIGYVWTSMKLLTHTMFNRPDVVVSTGMGYFDILMFPMCKLLRINNIYIEGAASKKSLTGTGKFVRLFADTFIVRWEDYAEELGCEFHGGVF